VIATVPAAPPSKLSKKLIELHIPTIQITVIAASRIVIPVGFPMLSFNIKVTARTYITIRFRMYL
jgi:ABC-type tungstate transport system substrate-binding protein